MAKPFEPERGLYTTVSSLGPNELGHKIRLRQPQEDAYNEGTQGSGPAWTVVGELLSVSHGPGARSTVSLRVANTNVHLDLPRDIEVEKPPLDWRI